VQLALAREGIHLYGEPEAHADTAQAAGAPAV